MTAINDDLIRAFLADEARRAVAAAPSFDEAVGRLAPRIGGRPSGASQRLTVSLAATMLLVAALGTATAVGTGILRLPLVIDSSRVNPFEGTWVSTSDTDGGTQTMTVHVSAEGAVEITVLDHVATVCSGTPSTMTGTGRIEDRTALVIPSPVYTCDNGSDAEALSGPPLQEQLRDWTLFLDAQTDTLSDGVGGVWSREGAEIPGPEPSSEPTISDSAWPQSSLDEVMEAQELADAGDPGYTWQVDPQLSQDEWWAHVRERGAEIVDRFLRDELGWDQFLFNPYQPGESGYPADPAIRRVVYLRCAPNDTNPLYPIDPEGHQEAPGAERCGPTIDELRYESVSLDLTQPDQRGPAGVWVVSRSRMTAPFTQTDPVVAEAAATTQLEAFLRARVEGEDAEGYVELSGGQGFRTLEEVPLLYTTTTGAPYERFELERVSEPRWPYGDMEFTVRLFADGGETVVEQQISLRNARLFHDARETTENGRPLAVDFAFFDGQVTLLAADPWELSPFFNLALALNDQSGEERVELLGHPLPVGTGCAQGPAPVDADALARSIQSDADLVATAPVAVSVGGAEGLAMDITVAPGASVCELIPSTQVLTHAPDGYEGSRPPGLDLDQGSRMRLYLLDLPEGFATRILAMAIVAPEARFESVVEAAAPVVDSIEFHAP